MNLENRKIPPAARRYAGHGGDSRRRAMRSQQLVLKKALSFSVNSPKAKSPPGVSLVVHALHASVDDLPVTTLKAMPRPTPKKCKLVFTGNVYHIGAGARRVPTAPQGSPRKVPRTTPEPELKGVKAVFTFGVYFLEIQTHLCAKWLILKSFCSGFSRIQRLSAATVSLEAAKNNRKAAKKDIGSEPKKGIAYHYHSNRYHTTAQKNEIVVKYHFLPVNRQHCCMPYT